MALKSISVPSSAFFVPNGMITNARRMDGIVAFPSQAGPR
jgi:hypothetical protein